MDNLLNIDYKSLLPYVIESFTKVYGEEYREIIKNKINKARIIGYQNPEELSLYINSLERCKATELIIKFLNCIGKNIKNEKNLTNYLKELKPEITNELDFYFNFPYGSLFFEIDDNFLPKNLKKDDEKLLNKKIKLINHLLNDKDKQITIDNYKEFINTDEYNQISKKIDELNVIYEGILQEYNEFQKKLVPYKNYVNSEKKRKEDIFQEKKKQIYIEIYESLPITIKNLIKNYSLDEQVNFLFGNDDISIKFPIEYFDKIILEKLKSKNISLSDKIIISMQISNYLENIDKSLSSLPMCNNEEDIKNFLSILNQKKIKSIIPSNEVINKISELRKIKYEESIKEYYLTREDTLKIKNSIGNSSSLLEYIKENRVCVLGLGYSATNKDGEFISIMSYTNRATDIGFLFYTFMHECGHIIDQNENACGFELDNDNYNKYNKIYRKYERFNEILNDIFTTEAVKCLHSQNIYLIESKELTNEDLYADSNTSKIVKNLLEPIYQKFKKQFAKAKINANHEELTKYIGNENFEELVDVINKIDYLCDEKKLSDKLNNFQNDPIILEYSKEVEKLRNIYQNIDNYYINNYQTINEEQIHHSKR